MSYSLLQPHGLLSKIPKPDCVGCPTEEPVCPTQEAKPSGIDKRDDLSKKLQLELKSPPTPVREEEELKRTDDGKRTDIRSHC